MKLLAKEVLLAGFKASISCELYHEACDAAAGSSDMRSTLETIHFP
jgi:hypothetical protein